MTETEEDERKFTELSRIFVKVSLDAGYKDVHLLSACSLLIAQYSFYLNKSEKEFEEFLDILKEFFKELLEAKRSKEQS